MEAQETKMKIIVEKAHDEAYHLVYHSSKVLSAPRLMIAKLDILSGQIAIWLTITLSMVQKTLTMV